MPKQNPSLSVNCVFPTTSSMYLGMIVQLYFSKQKLQGDAPLVRTRTAPHSTGGGVPQ